MKSALLSKAALCICPPAVVAGTVAAVPPVRHAVHRFTAAYEPHKHALAKPAPCTPLQQHKTFASDLPQIDESPIDLTPQPVAFPAFTPDGGLPPTFAPPGSTQPAGPGVVPDEPISGVPEPSAWLTLTVGFGMIGAGVRQRRRVVLRNRSLALANGFAPGSAPVNGVGAMGGGAFAAISAIIGASGSPLQANTRLAQVGAKSLHSAFLAKAAMCVCPPVAMALGTAAIPTVRHAVYKATSPSAPKPALRHTAGGVGLPCLPTDQLTAAEQAKQDGERLAVLPSTPTWPGNAESTGGL